MPIQRIQFYVGTWSGAPADEDCYDVPRNPASFDPMDSDGTDFNQGIHETNYVGRYYDNRPLEFIWEDTPAIPSFVTMVKTLESYVGYSEVYVNLGNSIAPALYGTTDNWFRIRAIEVPLEYAPGNISYMSGGASYNRYSSITFKFTILEEM